MISTIIEIFRRLVELLENSKIVINSEFPKVRRISSFHSTLVQIKTFDYYCEIN